MEKALKSGAPEPDLRSQAIDAVVGSDWLVNLVVALVDGAGPNAQASQAASDHVGSKVVVRALQPPDIRVADVRRIIREGTGIPEEEQRLTLASTGEHVLHGKLPSPDTEGIVSLLLERASPDPRLAALFDMVRMSDAEERFELMATMMKSRRAGGCYCGGSDDWPMNVVRDSDEGLLESLCCARCFFRKRPGCVTTVGGEVKELLYCSDCGFSICSRCRHRADERWDPPEDPYEALAELAVGLGGKMAGFAAWFGGRGHFCGHPRVECRDGIAPRAYRGRYVASDASREEKREREPGVPVRRETKVLHDGVRMRIVLSEEVRAILGSRNTSGVEVDRVLPAGATCQDVMSYRGALKSSKDLWPIVAGHLEDQFSYYRTRDGDQARAYQTTKLLSFGIEEAVYELGANIDDGDY